MTPTKLLIGQILIVFAIVILGVWAATQWAAAMLGYQPELGAPIMLVGETPIYRPWDLFAWWYHFEAYAPHVFDKAGSLAAASGFLGCAAAIFGSLWRARQKGLVTTYGSARWAREREIDAAGLRGDSGVFLGTLRGRYLRHAGPEHVMAFAPTRSGKGVGLVVPRRSRPGLRGRASASFRSASVPGSTASAARLRASSATARSRSRSSRCSRATCSPRSRPWPRATMSAAPRAANVSNGSR